ncbi:MAG: NADP-dependent oxidoreductase [Xanthomonadales bacterium]|nr:NADP-dependent oxidoreductase [Xanthomonadales bacterium]
MTINRQWRVRRYPAPDEIIGPEHFELTEAPVPEIGPDEFLVRTLVLGTSPAQRGYVDTRKPDLVPLGKVMRGRGLGVVEASNHPDFAPGDWVNASMGWQEWSVQTLGRGTVQSMDVLSVQKVNRSIRPSELHLGTLGSAAFAALYGLDDLGQLAPGKTVLVSAAAGGVGSMACQIARANGCRVIGIAGGPAKCGWLTDELGCDAAIDYKNQDLSDELPHHCPDGVDVYFDNVGGEQLNQVLGHLAFGARVVICGYISTQYLPERSPGPANYTQLLGRRARMEGFVIWDHVKRFPEFFERLHGWYLQGKIKAVEEMSPGIESAPDSLRSLFTGANRGIRLTRVSDDPEPAE